MRAAKSLREENCPNHAVEWVREGHDFSRAVSSLKICPRFSA